MASDYLNDLKDKVKLLQDGIDGKSLELQLISSEMEEVTEASICISETSLLIIQMMIELNEFVQKKGSTEKSIYSQKRLARLLELNGGLDKISSQNYRLKLINRELHTNYQILRVENKELKKKLQSVIDAQNF